MLWNSLSVNEAITISLRIRIRSIRVLLFVLFRDFRSLRWLYIVFFKGLDITTASIIFPLANVYHIVLGRRSKIKSYSLGLHVEDSFRT